jgi:hypothetical protein
MAIPALASHRVPAHLGGARRSLASFHRKNGCRERRACFHGPDRGSGLGTRLRAALQPELHAESQLISPEVYEKADQNKFIPVAFEMDEAGKAFLPAFLKGRIYVDLSSVEKQYTNYEQLLRAIFDRPLHQKPKLGALPNHLLSESVAHPSTRYHFDRVKDALAGGKPQALGLIREYLRQKVEDLESYRIAADGRTPAYDDLVLDSIKAMLPYREEVVDFFLAFMDFKSEPEVYEELAEFFQSALGYHFRPSVTSGWTDVSADNFKFLTYEIFLYFVAALIKRRRFEEASDFLSREFYVTNLDGNGRVRTFQDIRPYLESLDNHRNRRLKLNRLSVVADLVKDRATRKDITFDDLAATDLVLHFRGYLSGGPSGYWHPYTAIYQSVDGTPRKLFRMAESARHFASLKVLLGIDAGATGHSLLQQYLDNGGQPRLSFGSGGFPLSIGSVMNFDKLGTRA